MHFARFDQKRLPVEQKGRIADRERGRRRPAAQTANQQNNQDGAETERPDIMYYFFHGRIVDLQMTDSEQRARFSGSSAKSFARKRRIWSAAQRLPFPRLQRRALARRLLGRSILL
jgi:hypothetical protein